MSASTKEILPRNLNSLFSMSDAFLLAGTTTTAESAMHLKAGYDWVEGPGLTPEPVVTRGMEVLCVGAVGVGRSVSEAKGTSTLDISASLGERGCDTSETAGTSGMHTTLEWHLHLCLQVTLQDLNFYPHALHCHSRGGSLAAFAAS